MVVYLKWNVHKQRRALIVVFNQFYSQIAIQMRAVVVQVVVVVRVVALPVRCHEIVKSGQRGISLTKIEIVTIHVASKSIKSSGGR